jgi:uncharacterized repeat protein (TIGR03803 family)
MKTKALFLLTFLSVYFLRISGQCSEFWSIVNYNDNAKIFSVDNSGNLLYSQKITFNQGIWPTDPIIEATNGKLYGMTGRGGSSGRGVIYEFNPNTSIYKVVFNFSGYNGDWPDGSLYQADNGLIYGMTSLGGGWNYGVFFKFNPADYSYSIIKEFNGRAFGANPYGSVMQAANRKIYGVTTNGGIHNSGVLFEYDPVTNIFIKKVDFDQENYPCGTPVQTADGLLYGLTEKGGSHSAGSIFAYDLDKDSLIIKHSFTSGDSGGYPRGSLYLESNGKLYGVTSSGGINCIKVHDIVNCFGILFEWDPQTNRFTKKFDFNEDTDRSSKYLLTSGGKLYGFGYKMYMYSYDIIADSVSYWKIDRNINSMMHTADNKLYCLSGDDRIYEFNPEDTTFARRFDFYSQTNGKNFQGKLLDFDNGKMYGVAGSGGVYNAGVLFEWDRNSKTYTKKFDFTPQNAGPNGNLVKTKNGRILGFTIEGGKTNTGILFEWNPENNEFYNITDFVAVTEKAHPDQVIQSEDGEIFIVFKTDYSDSGRIYHFNSITREYKLIRKGTPVQPIGLMTFYKGLAYGISSVGGNENNGIIYTWDPLTDTYAKKTDMSEICEDQLILTKEGVFYGYTSSGHWFVYNPVLNTFKIDNTIPVDLVHLQYMTEGNDGKFYQVQGSSFNKWDPDKHQLSAITFRDTIALSDAMRLTEIIPESSTIDTAFIQACHLYYVPGTSYVYSRPGIYRICLKNKTGSDSAVYLKIAIIDEYDKSIDVSSCDSYISTGGSVLNSSGTYMDTIPNDCGCDSIITINLQIDHVDTTVIQDRNVLVSADQNANYQWIDADNLMPIEGETFLTYTPDHNGRYAVIVTQGTCMDTSSVYTMIVTETENVINSDIQLFPNPTRGKVTIDLGKVYDEATVSVLNSSGMVIQEKKMKNARQEEIILNEPGMYLVKIRTCDGETIHRVIKQ